MLATILVILTSLTAYATPSVDFYCKDDYIAETHRLNDLYTDGDVAKDARVVLRKRGTRELVGGAIGTAVATMFLYPMLKRATDNQIAFSASLAPFLALPAGGLPGAWVGGNAVSKETKNREKMGAKYLKELKYLFDTTVYGHSIVKASKVIVDRDQYLPQEVEASVMVVGQFITSARLELMPSEAATAIVAADSDGSLCPNHQPLTSDQIANLLKE